MDICMAVYYGRINDDVFETFLKTFRKVSGALLQVYTDNIPEDMSGYGVKWHLLKREQIKGRRCLCKMECVRHCLNNLKDGDRLIVSDVDVYFLDDPFSAFEKCDFNVGVTKRLHSYKFPVNGGLFFVNTNKKSRAIFGEKFDIYIEDNPESADWFIDQNYLCWLSKKGDAVDVGWEYNFCPNTDVFGVKLAVSMIRRAYESKAVKVLHLKSELKMCIYDGYMENAVTKRLTGGWNWKNDGK